MGRRRKPEDQPRERTTPRNVFFFRAHTGLNPDESLRAFSARSALAEIDRLPFEEGGRYLRDTTDTDTCAWIDRADGAPERMRLGTIRRGDLPRLEVGGTLRPLPIPPESGLAEETHFSFFGQGIVGVLFNSYGPRPARLVSYIAARCSEPHSRLSLEPLIRRDVAQQLQRLESIRLIDFGIRRSEMQVIEEHDSDLYQILEGARVLGGAQRVRLVLQPEAYSREGLGARASQLIRRLLRIPRLREIVDHFAVRGYDPDAEGVVNIDVLREQLVSRQEVIRQDRRSRALQLSSAYEAIERSFDQLRDEILQAASLVIPSPRQ